MQQTSGSFDENIAAKQALAQVLESVDSDRVAREARSTALNGFRRLELPPLKRPFLSASDETSTTHSAFEAYRTLRTKLVRFQSTRGVRSVVISSAEAGEGKTVSVVNLGLSMAQLPSQRVLLVDADLRTFGLSTATGALESPGLAEVLSEDTPFEKAPVATNIPNLFIVGAGDAHTPAGDLFAGPMLKQFIGWCNENFSMVLVDCPPILGLADFEVVSAACDGVLLVIRAQRTKRQRLADLVPVLGDKKLLGLLLNGQERRPHKSRYGYYYAKNVNKPSVKRA